MSGARQSTHHFAWANIDGFLHKLVDPPNRVRSTGPVYNRIKTVLRSPTDGLIRACDIELCYLILSDGRIVRDQTFAMRRKTVVVDSIEWHATPTGVYRGVVPLGFESGLRSLDIRDIMKSRTGQVWVATAGGVHQWVDDRFEPWQTGAGFAPANAILADRENRIWAATDEGLYVYQDVEFRRIDGLPDEAVLDLELSADGTLRVLLADEVYRRTAPDVFEPEGFRERGLQNAHKMTALDDGRLLVATRTNGLFVRHLNENVQVLTAESGLLDNRINDLAVSAGGRIYIATEGGLTEYVAEPEPE